MAPPTPAHAILDAKTVGYGIGLQPSASTLDDCLRSFVNFFFEVNHTLGKATATIFPE